MTTQEKLRRLRQFLVERDKLYREKRGIEFAIPMQGVSNDFRKKVIELQTKEVQGIKAQISELGGLMQDLVKDIDKDLAPFGLEMELEDEDVGVQRWVATIKE